MALADGKNHKVRIMIMKAENINFIGDVMPQMFLNKKQKNPFLNKDQKVE